jgi:phosphoglycerol transferase MdoB-like AlkP superfamily enzyme
MKQRLKLFLLYALYWLLIFIVSRVLFMLYSFNLSFEITTKEWFLIIAHGLKLDISATGYIMAIVSILFLVTSFFSGKVLRWVLSGLTLVFLVFTMSIIVSDFELYQNWGYRMDATPLLYILQPKDALASVETWLIFVLFAVMIALTWFYYYVFRKTVLPIIEKVNKAGILTALLFLLIAGLMIIPIRGGFGIAPMNTGKVYFSKNSFSNHAAVNVVWNVINSLVYKKNTEKTYQFFEAKQAYEIFAELNRQSGNRQYVLQKKDPNIVIIILESFSSKVLESVGGQWPVAKNLNNLSKEGILFTNLYANADRSDKGIVSILSGYPAQPATSVIKFPNKTQSLPFISKELKKKNYQTYFYYGGDIDFANMRSYFINGEFDNLVTDESFDKKLLTSKWGAHDEFVFDRLYADMLADTGRYLKVFFTLSSHDPFNVPFKCEIKGTDRASQYLNSVCYSDSCLGDFFAKIKKTPSWDNTLFVLIADHGSGRPGNNKVYSPEKYKIPMIWLGGALEKDSLRIDAYGSQLDVAKTLLNQLDINADQFTFSKDLFDNSGHKFGYYTFNDGFGFIDSSSVALFDNTKGDTILMSGKCADSLLLKGKAFLQVSSADFQSR